MKIIDIYGENHFEQYTELREACRGVVIKNNKILVTIQNLLSKDNICISI